MLKNPPNVRTLLLALTCALLISPTLPCIYPFLEEKGSSFENVKDSAEVLPSSATPSIHYQGERSGRAPERNPVPFMNYGDVALIVNDNSQMSRDIADYFLANRNFPDKNVVNITAPASETVSRSQFNTFRGQIEENFTDRNLTKKINYIVTTKGVPLRISDSGEHRASVDSELALILGRNQGQIGNYRWMINPYYTEEGEFDSQQYGMYLVTRLTGYTLEEIKGLIDLAGDSLNETGKFVLDVDPGRDGSPGYKVGNDWLRGANSTLSQRGYDVLHDETNTFVNNITNVAGYGSWGSNDGHWFKNLLSNSNMETDGDGDDIPDGWWAVVEGNGTVKRTGQDAHRNSYSVNVTQRDDTGESALYRNFTVEPDARYYLTGYANLSGVSGEGSAHLRIRAHDARDNVIWQVNGTERSGTTTDWKSMGQTRYEPLAGVRKISIGCVLSRSAGTVFFDHLRLNEIRPRLEFVPGGIAETFVSTSGRSFNYPTGYGQSLVADLIREGATGVKGYCFEPYLAAISHPDILFDRYTTGHNLAQSYWSGSNFVSWMGTVVGDPKTCPYIFERAELKVESVDISVEDPRQDQDVFLNISVKNSGGSRAPSFSVVVRDNVNGPVLFTRDTSLNANSSTMLSFGLDLEDRGGANRLSVAVDSGNRVMETFENNNDAEFEFYVNKRPSVNGTLPVIEVEEDAHNNSLVLSELYFSDFEADDVYFDAILLNPTQDEFDNVRVEVEGDRLNVSVRNNYTDEEVPVRVFCGDRRPVEREIFQDTYVKIIPVDDPPFVSKIPGNVSMNEGDVYRWSSLRVDEVFDDVDSEELFYSLSVRPREVRNEGVDVRFDPGGRLEIVSEGDYNGNFTVAVFCSDAPVNDTDNVSGRWARVDMAVRVKAVNDPPELLEDEIRLSVPEEAEEYPVLNLTTIYRDVDTDFGDLDWSVEDVHGIAVDLSVEGNFLIVTLPANRTGELPLKIRVSDGEFSDSIYLYLVLLEINDPPVVDITEVVRKDTILEVRFRYIDSDSPPGEMVLNVSVDGVLELDADGYTAKALGGDWYAGTTTVEYDPKDLAAGNHTLRLTLTDNASAAGTDEIAFELLFEWGDDDGNDTGTNGGDDDDENGTKGGDGGDGSGVDKEMFGVRGTICLVLLFVGLAFGIALVLLYLHRRRKKDIEQAKEEHTDLWEERFGKVEGTPKAELLDRIGERGPSVDGAGAVGMTEYEAEEGGENVGELFPDHEEEDADEEGATRGRGRA